MPHVSGRSKLLNELEMMLLTLLKHGDVNSADFEELLTFRSTVQAIRYLDLQKQIRKDREMEALLKRMTPAQFKLYARMDLASFVAILARIKADDVFKTPNNLKKQAPVWCQFWVVLQRLDCSGNGASIGRIGFQSGFSTGSVHAFTKRVSVTTRRVSAGTISVGQVACTTITSSNARRSARSGPTLDTRSRILFLLPFVSLRQACRTTVFSTKCTQALGWSSSTLMAS